MTSKVVLQSAKSTLWTHAEILAERISEAEQLRKLADEAEKRAAEAEERRDRLHIECAELLEFIHENDPRAWDNGNFGGTGWIYSNQRELKQKGLGDVLNRLNPDRG